MATTKLTRAEINEEIDFFRDYCGWSEKRIADHLGLSYDLFEQRRYREQGRRNKAVLDEAA